MVASQPKSLIKLKQTEVTVDTWVSYLPHVNATLNAIATVLLVGGVVLIRRGKEDAHRKAMLACFGVSVLFLTSYLVYHVLEKSTPFPKTAPTSVRWFYFSILIPHVILAAFVPFLAIAAIYFGLKNRRAAHRRIVKFAFPIWLFVSVTGVVVYVMLYHLYPPGFDTAIL